MSGTAIDAWQRAGGSASACLLVGMLPVTWVLLRHVRSVLLTRVLVAAAVTSATTALLSGLRLVQLVARRDEDLLRGVLASEVTTWTLLRIPLALALLVVLLSGTRFRDRPPGSWWLSWCGLSLLLLATLPLTGHAADTGAVATAVQWLHLVAASVWIGGITALAVVVPLALRLRDDRGEVGGETLLDCARSFSRLAAGAVLVTVVTGVAEASMQAIDLGSAGGSLWRQAALVKGLLFLAVLVAGAFNHGIVLRRLGLVPAEQSRVLVTAVSLEVVLGAGLLLAAAVLVSVPQP